MKFRTAATAALALTAALVLAGCSAGNDDGSMPGMDHGASEQAADVNDADVMFASMMIVHHEQAIEMSDIVLAKEGVAPEGIDQREGGGHEVAPTEEVAHRFAQCGTVARAVVAA